MPDLSEIRIVERAMSDTEFARRRGWSVAHAAEQGSATLAPESIGVVALDHDTYAGSATIEIYRQGDTYNGWAYLSDLYVETPYRGIGLGALLLSQTEERAVNLGIRQIWTRTASYEAPRFYEKQGYRVCYELERYFRSGHSTVGLRKTLEANDRAGDPSALGLSTVRLVDRTPTDAEVARMNEGFVEHAMTFGDLPQVRERHGFVALGSDGFIGCVSGLLTKQTSVHGEWFVLTDLFVEKGCRGRGLGASLLLRMEKRVAQLGIKHILTRIAGYETPEFFAKLGFDVICDLEGWHRGGYSSLTLRKALRR